MRSNPVWPCSRRGPGLERMQARTDIVSHGPIAGGPGEHAVLAERGAIPGLCRASSPGTVRVDRTVERTDPPTVDGFPPQFPRVVAHCRNNQQIARASGRYVGQAHALGPVASEFLFVVLQQ